MPPLLFSTLRFTVVVLPAIFFVPIPKASWKLLIGAGFSLGVVKFSLLFVGMDLGMSAGLASLLLQMQVFFTIGFAWLILSERPGWAQWLGVALAFSGVVLISNINDAHLNSTALLLVVGAAVAWGVANIFMKTMAGMLALKNQTFRYLAKRFLYLIYSRSKCHFLNTPY